MKHRLAILFSIILLIIIAGYVYIRYTYLKADDYEPDETKAESPIDLKPAIIAKLQQVVKDGSNGLYRLSVGEMDLNILASTGWIKNAVIKPDSQTLSALLAAKQLADDVYTIQFDSMHLSGFGTEDLLNKKVLDINTVYFSKPRLYLAHKLRNYNESKRATRDSLTLYRRILNEMKTVRIGQINIDNGRFFKQPPGKQIMLSELNGIRIRMKDILIDSTTEYDASRFMFAKTAEIEMRDYELRTSDSLYKFKSDVLNINAASKSVTMRNISFDPRRSKQEFYSGRTTRKEMFHFKVPMIRFNNVSWWTLLNKETMVADEVEIPEGELRIYLDKSLPKPVVPNGSFPQQLLMKLPFPINIKRLNVSDLDLAYEEYNPIAGRSDVVRFSNLNATASGFTNISSETRRKGSIRIDASCRFLDAVPLKLGMVLDLKNTQAGNFNAMLDAGSLDGSLANTISETLGLVRIKKGHMNKAHITVMGNHLSSTTRSEFLYNDLHLTPLKPETGDDGRYKKKRMISLIANALIIKNNNPSPGESPRLPIVHMKRASTSGFFNYLWFSILTGILETIGIPPSRIIKV